MERFTLVVTIVLALAFASEASACCRRAPVRKVVKAAAVCVKAVRPKNIVARVKARRAQRSACDAPACEPVEQTGCVGGVCPLR